MNGVKLPFDKTYRARPSSPGSASIAQEEPAPGLSIKFSMLDDKKTGVALIGDFLDFDYNVTRDGLQRLVASGAEQLVIDVVSDYEDHPAAHTHLMNEDEQRRR